MAAGIFISRGEGEKREGLVRVYVNIAELGRFGYVTLFLFRLGLVRLSQVGLG